MLFYQEQFIQLFVTIEEAHEDTARVDSVEVDGR
jgi:hypothetical protein